MIPYAERQYGVPYLHIHRADYHRILVAEAERLGVTLALDSTVVKIDFENPSIRLKNKPEFYADLILGADGLKSTCRQCLLGHPDPPCPTGDLAYRIIVKATDMRKHPDLRELAEKPAINYWMGPDAHAVCYLLKGGDLYNIVLICPDNLPERVTTAKADVQEMREFFEKWDPRLKTLLGLVQETSKWRLQNSTEMKAWSHPSGKFALLGDACHATLPYLLVSHSLASLIEAFLPAVTNTSDFIEPKVPPKQSKMAPSSVPSSSALPAPLNYPISSPSTKPSGSLEPH